MVNTKRACLRVYGDEKTAYYTAHKAKDTLEVDGAAINTRIEDENGSTWKENKFGILFDDKNLYRREDGSNIILHKEYVSYFGSIEEFQKHVFSTALKYDFQKYKIVIFISDGAT